MKKHTKIINDYLMASNRYLDQHGYRPDARLPERIIASPANKIGAASIIGLSTAFALAGMNDMALYNLVYIPIGAAYTENIRNIWDKQKFIKFYFDTAPEKKKPIPNIGLEFYLRIVEEITPKRLMRYTALSTLPLLTMPVLGEQAPLAIGFSTMIASTIASNFWAMGWRATQVLDGNWNAMMDKPKSAPAPEKITLLAPPKPI